MTLRGPADVSGRGEGADRKRKGRAGSQGAYPKDRLQGPVREKTGEKLRRPQPPFTTLSLQQEASRKLNSPPPKPCRQQQLYEGIDLGKAGTVGLVTYIRTDSVRVSTEAVEAARLHPDSVRRGLLP